MKEIKLEHGTAQIRGYLTRGGQIKYSEVLTKLLKMPKIDKDTVITPELIIVENEFRNVQIEVMLTRLEYEGKTYEEDQINHDAVMKISKEDFITLAAECEPFFSTDKKKETTKIKE